MNIDTQKLATLATCMISEVNSYYSDNDICVAEFKDRFGNVCQLHLVVKSEPQELTAAPNPCFNCMEPLS
ncbi:hypothetical protein [Sedimenticola sp.]|uniref:hypothetical protein n=1 Tax=Sedimenticola sp. TaxID=1940285 RepID=UPI003D115B7D